MQISNKIFENFTFVNTDLEIILIENLTSNYNVEYSHLFGRVKIYQHNYENNQMVTLPLDNWGVLNFNDGSILTIYYPATINLVLSGGRNNGYQVIAHHNWEGLNLVGIFNQYNVPPLELDSIDREEDTGFFNNNNN